VRTATGSGCDEIFVVLGASADRMRPELEGLDVRPVLNPDWASGMGSSIGTGLEAALREPHPWEGVLILLADQPLVLPSHLRRMVSLFRRSRAPIVVAHYDRHPGPPALFASALFPELLALEGGQGARALLERRRRDTLYFDLPEAGVDVDVDADYQSLLMR
jgi:molybdenum cofactor cytidylyltransferase